MATYARLDIASWRTEARVLTFRIHGMDLTGVNLRQQVRQRPDTPGTPLIDLATVVSANAQGLRFVGVETVEGVPVSTFTARYNASTLRDLPYLGEIGGDSEFSHQLQIGGVTRFAGAFWARATTIDSESAPVNRVTGNGERRAPGVAATVSATIAGEDVVELKLDGADALWPPALAALEARDEAKAARDVAELAAATALASSRYFTSRALGEAGSTTGQAFSTDDGAGNLIFYKDTGGGSTEIGRAVTPSALAASGGSALVGVKRPGVGLPTRTVEDALFDTVSVKQFGAKCDTMVNADGTFSVGTDDTAAVQKAIDYALSLHRPVQITFPGPGLCWITASLIVNRPVYFANSTPFIHDELRFIGAGGGFFVNSAITILTSNIAPLPEFDPSEPPTEQISFHGMGFESSDASLAAYVASEKFIRVAFNQCYFARIKALNCSVYAQSWRFTDCNIRFWNGVFFKVVGTAYDVKVINCLMEFGGFSASNDNNHAFQWEVALGCALIGNCFEGSRGGFLRQDGSGGLTVTGNYHEGNTAANYVFSTTATGGVGKGISFVGNKMSGTTAGFDVVLGDVRGLASSGNYCTGKMFDVTGVTVGEFVSTGDRCELQKFSDDRFWETLPAGVEKIANGIVAHAGGGQANATVLTKPVNRVTTVAAPGDSVSLPPSSFVDASFGLRITVVNATANALAVFHSPIDVANFGAGDGRGTAISVPAGAAVDFVAASAGKFHAVAN